MGKPSKRRLNLKPIEACTFDDVLIAPRYSEVRSRSDVNLATKLGDIELCLPVISSNMKTITGSKMASTIAMLGGIGILHRFCSVEENVEMYEYAIRLINAEIPADTLAKRMFSKNVGVSLGVKDDDKRRFENLYKAGARIFCIDVAHGHHVLVKEMVEWLQGCNITIIAGNIATAEAYDDFVDWGVDIAKVGIGPGAACITRKRTGVGVPQLYALEQVYNASLSQKKPIPFIADGGISMVGDAVKALKYADAVMLGSFFSGTSETPGHVFRNEHDEMYKTYGGSASGENKGENKFVEGVVKTVRFKGKVKYLIKELTEGIQSACSYVGAKDLIEFKENCEFVRLSPGAQKESKL
jgi:IMP dehydrogenase